MIRRGRGWGCGGSGGSGGVWGVQTPLGPRGRHVAATSEAAGPPGITGHHITIHRLEWEGPSVNWFRVLVKN